jgi:3-oxoacyl-[acyl-carrier protein] reductase
LSRTVLVTGGSSGMGRAIAAAFVADHAEVTITGRHADTVELAAREIGARGVVCDATDTTQLTALADRFDTVDVLVNTAGGIPDATDAGLSPLAAAHADWQANLAQNLLSAVLTTTAVRDKLSDVSSVISIGSIGAERRGGAYGTAKAALAAWNALLSAELAPQGVTCNVISAGYVTGTNFFRGRMTDERHAALVAETHTKRPGTVDDIAATAFFLASAGARHITGQTIHVNGGAFTTR